MPRLKSHAVLRGGAVLVCAVAIAAAGLSTGCNTTGCIDNQSSIPLAEMYSSSTSQVITLGNLEISGVGSRGADSIIAGANSASFSRVYLPMRSTKETTAWCLHYTQEGLESPEFNDTVEFGYTSEPYFASEECGAMYRYRIHTMRNTFHLLDSVVIVDSLITNADVVTLKFYFRTQNEPQEPEEQS